MAQDDETPIPGEVISTQKTKIFYDSVTMGSNTYKKNEVVHMESDDPDPYVGLIMDIFQVRKEKVLMVNVRWFFRWGDLDQTPNVDREQYPEEVFLGLTIDPNPVEAIASPCNFDWLCNGTYQERMAQKVLCHKKKQFFCSHLYNGECLVPLFSHQMSDYFEPNATEEIKRIQVEIIGDRDPIEDEEADDLTKKKKKKPVVKKEPKKEPEDNSQESRKRKSLDGGEEREPEAKRLRSEELEQNFSNKATFENMREITLPRNLVLKWQNTDQSLLLGGFYVRVPVLRMDLKSYLLAKIQDVHKIEPGAEREFVEDIELKHGLRLRIPEVEDLVSAGIQHVSSHELTRTEYEAYKKHGSLPEEQDVKQYIIRKKEMEDKLAE